MLSSLAPAPLWAFWEELVFPTLAPFSSHGEPLPMRSACGLSSKTQVANRLQCIILVIVRRWLKTGYWRNYKLYIHTGCVFIHICVCLCVYVYVSGEGERFPIKGNCTEFSLFLGSWSHCVGIFLRVVRRPICGWSAILNLGSWISAPRPSSSIMPADGTVHQHLITS